jgi:hypothetical protein
MISLQSPSLRSVYFEAHKISDSSLEAVLRSLSKKVG